MLLAPGVFFWLNTHMEENTPEQPARKKPGPNGEPKWGEKVVTGIIVGRDKTVVPPEEVEELAAIGCNDRDIANWFGVNEDTLRYNFKPYLVKGREKLKIGLRKAMLHNAINNMNAALQIFLSKNILGMSDSGQGSSQNQVLPFSDDDVATQQPIEEEDYDTTGE